jgi:hypothetical protein
MFHHHQQQQQQQARFQPHFEQRDSINCVLWHELPLLPSVAGATPVHVKYRGHKNRHLSTPMFF